LQNEGFAHTSGHMGCMERKSQGITGRENAVDKMV
jgi:hypothetical protein